MFGLNGVYHAVAGVGVGRRQRWQASSRDPRKRQMARAQTEAAEMEKAGDAQSQ